MIVFNYSGNPSNVGMGFGFFFDWRQVQMIHTTQRFFFYVWWRHLLPGTCRSIVSTKKFYFLCSISIETNYYLKKKKNPKNFFWLLFYLSGSCFFSTCVYYVKLIITGCLSFLFGWYSPRKWFQFSRAHHVFGNFNF